MRQDFFFSSGSGAGQLHGIHWIPEGKIVAVLQIVHGMAEHIGRYDEFARYLCDRGVLVVGHSHPGHGKSVKGPDDLGFFAEVDPNGCVVGAIHALRTLTRKAYPDVPYFILGHSMGSFLTRQYLGIGCDGLAGAVIMGTGDMPPALLRVAKGICALLARFRGWHYRSTLVNGMVLGGYEKKLGTGWLSKNEENVRRYAEDPLCGFCFTLNGFYGLFTGFHRAVRQERAGQLPKDIPILFVSGSEDPVGGCGKDVQSVYRRYLSHGARAEMKLYAGDRHEILNEDDRLTVYEDIHRWMAAAAADNAPEADTQERD